MLSRIVALSILVVALVIGNASAHGAVGPNLLGNQGFESPATNGTARFRVPHTIGLCRPGGLANHPQAGCWTVGSGSVDVMVPGPMPTQAGTQYIDLNGTGQGQIMQQVPASQGIAYEITFFGRSSRNQAMTIAYSVYWYNAAGGLIATGGFPKAQTQSGAWTKYRLEVVSPTGTAYARIYLTSQTQPAAPYAGQGPLVDNVVFRSL